MNQTPFFSTLFAVLALAATGCKERPVDPPQTGPTTIPESVATAPAAEKWLGKWNGPEGTFLQLDGGNGQYEVTIRNLDGPRTFKGTVAGDRLEFDRDGVRESVRASNGAETGMKWLSEKKDCLTVRTGEGYCRD